MARWFYATATVLLLGFHLIVPASAGWLDEDISAIQTNVSTLITRTKNIVDDTGDLVTTLADARGDFSDSLQDLIANAKDALNEISENEQAELDAFLNSSAPDEVRQQLKDIVLCAGDLLNTQIQLELSLDIDCLPGPPELSFDRIIELIDEVPDIALYPLHRAQEFLKPLLDVLIPLLECAKGHTEEIFDLLVSLDNDELDPEDLFTDQDALTELRTLSKILWRARTACKVVGPLMVFVAENFDMQFEVALWGWVGVSIDSDAVKTAGQWIEATPPPLLKRLAQTVDKHVEKAATASFRAAVLANQETMIRYMVDPDSLRDARIQNRGLRSRRRR